MFSVNFNDKQLSNFWNKVSKKDNDLCWHWTGGTNYAGTGIFSNNLRSATAAKIIYYLTYGEFDDSLYVIPKCLTTHCINPNHLYLGDRSELNKNRGLILEKSLLKYKKDNE